MPYMRYIKSFFLVLLSAAFLVFAIANRQTVHLSLFPLPYSADMPEFLFAILCFSLGVVVGGFAVHLKLAKSTRLFKSEHKRVMALQNEVSALHAERSVIPGLSQTVALDPRMKRG